MLLREQNTFSISEVDYAILETNGKLSVMKKQEQQQPTKLDMSIPVKNYKYFPSEIITDGNIIKKNLKEFNLKEEWLTNQLKLQNIQSPKEVLYAEIQKDGTIYFEKY